MPFLVLPQKRKELSPLGSKSPVNNSWLKSLTDQIENQTKSFFYCNTEFGLCHKQFPCTWTFLPISNKIEYVTKLISTECKFCCCSLWITKVWWTSRSLPSCLKKLKLLAKLYTVGPAKHVRWVMGLPTA